MHFVSFSNCQGSGVIHFLKKSECMKGHRFTQVNNWQLVLLETPRANLYEAISSADVLLYQPTGKMLCTDGEYVPSADELIAEMLPKKAMTISFAYQYNSGFFPILKVAEGRAGWDTGEDVKRLAEAVSVNELLARSVILHYDCARRFIECLAEQSRREQETDIRMVPFILEHYRTKRLFLTQNHPTSVIFAELARQIINRRFSTKIDPPPIESDNEVGMNGVLPVHPAVVRELGLLYKPDLDVSPYWTMLQKMSAELRKFQSQV